MGDEPNLEPLTPVAIEQRLRFLYNQLARAAKLLAEARDVEVRKRHDYLSARRRVILSGMAPKVSRGQYTAADRDAFVDSQVEDAEFEYRVAEAAREAAQDHLRITRDQAEIVRSLGVGVRQAYELAGYDG